VATKQIAETLAAGEHEVHILTTWFLGLKKYQTENSVHVHRVRVWGRTKLPTATIRSMVTFVPAALWRGWRLCRGKKFDVINAQFVVPSGIPAAILARMLRVPFVLSFIGGDLYDPTKGVSPHRHFVLRGMIRAVAEQAAICTAISEDTKWRAHELHGVDRDVAVTHLGVPTSPRMAGLRGASARAELGLPMRDPVFVTVGRLIARKRYDVLIRAWKDVASAHLFIIGDGPLRAELTRLTRELGVAERVHLQGFVSEENKRGILQAADGYVSATEHEGFGIVFLEAMQAGLPIVSTAEGGQKDFLEHEENALLVPTHDAAALARAVNRLLGDKSLAQKMRVNNLEKVKEFYLEKTVKKFEDVLTQAYESRH